MPPTRVACKPPTPRSGVSLDRGGGAASGLRARPLSRGGDGVRLPILIGMGANLGDPIRQLRVAVDRLSSIVDVEATSNVYRTAPVGLLDQPDFFNLVLSGATEATVYELLDRAREIEAELGRMRTVADGPRTIDVDLLTYGDLVLSSPELTIPHARMHLRPFVLVPLAEIAPEWRHPESGMTAEECLSRIADPSRVERWGALPRHQRGA